MKGFTLIEVMVSVAVALLVTGFIIANYNSYNDVQVLKQAALTLKNNLRFAQSKAMNGQIPTPTPMNAPPICSTLVGYTVTFTPPSSYTIQAFCDPEGLQGDKLLIPLPGGVTFSTSTPPPALITFNVLSRGTTLPSVTTITLTGFNKTYSLQVSPSGDVSDLGLK